MTPIRNQSEAAVLNETRIVTSQWGWRLWRNNKGAGKLENGSFIRWGLCNESPQIGSHMRSADLIGLRPVVIMPQHVGLTIAQFVSVECKSGAWKPTARDEHIEAQRRWADLINSLGGYAVITNDIENER